jgi:hypothetical protein
MRDAPNPIDGSPGKIADSVPVKYTTDYVSLFASFQRIIRSITGFTSGI